MKHARSDYDRIQDPAGIIPKNEPVFLLRGQDVAAPFAVRAWAGQAKLEGASDEIIGKALDQADRMEEWQGSSRRGRGTRGKTPDLPSVGAAQ